MCVYVLLYCHRTRAHFACVCVCDVACTRRRMCADDDGRDETAGVLAARRRNTACLVDSQLLLLLLLVGVRDGVFAYDAIDARERLRDYAILESWEESRGGGEKAV